MTLLAFALLRSRHLLTSSSSSFHVSRGDVLHRSTADDAATLKLCKCRRSVILDCLIRPRLCNPTADRLHYSGCRLPNYTKDAGLWYTNALTKKGRIVSALTSTCTHDLQAHDRHVKRCVTIVPHVIRQGRSGQLALSLSRWLW
ncbi:hypothetical protein OE88DRAFT_1264837 [Heliocybe sulcata]|uniref:Uncharacterized protein n=1 Tax=Heliocybe sulcata TaxID=5364 RepID=A0A5C3NC90_9AGAM|nr:hypothetical protein OE88DRAFT_1264837 [Heliocybe sulcata]